MLYGVLLKQQTEKELEQEDVTLFSLEQNFLQNAIGNANKSSYLNSLQ